jgi:hypothetical protein
MPDFDDLFAGLNHIAISVFDRLFDLLTDFKV